jgi:hypothetical protein
MRMFLITLKENTNRFLEMQAKNARMSGIGNYAIIELWLKLK